MGRHRALGVAAAVTLLLAACGGRDDDAADGDDGADPGDSRTDEYIGAVSAAMRENEVRLDPDQAACIAIAIVELVGVDTLTEADISPDELGDAADLSSLDLDMPGDAVDRLSTAVGECDIAGVIKEGLVDSFTREVSADVAPDGAACLSDNLNDGALTDAFARTLVDGQGRQHLQDPVASATAACPSVMTAVLIAQLPSAVPPSVEECVSDFVERNVGLVARSFASDSPDPQEELREPLVAACPEVPAPGG